MVSPAPCRPAAGRIVRRSARRIRLVAASRQPRLRPRGPLRLGRGVAGRLDPASGGLGVALAVPGSDEGLDPGAGLRDVARRAAGGRGGAGRWRIARARRGRLIGHRGGSRHPGIAVPVVKLSWSGEGASGRGGQTPETGVRPRHPRKPAERTQLSPCVFDRGPGSGRAVGVLLSKSRAASATSAGGTQQRFSTCPPISDRGITTPPGAASPGVNCF
jgi:hypothetical protein